MKFLYSDNNNNGIFSSLLHSWIFWIIIILIVIVVIVLMSNSNDKLGQNFNLQRMFGNATANDTSEQMPFATEISDSQLLNEHSINLQHHYPAEFSEHGGPVPDLNKFLDNDLDETSFKKTKLLGNTDPSNSNIHKFYAVPSSKEVLYKIADENLEEINFKIELKDLSKIPLPKGNNSDDNNINEIKIYNQKHNCIAILLFEHDKLTVKSISPYFNDTKIDLDKTIRLLAFKQISNKFYLDQTQVGAFNNYDKITYFAINASLIKEIQYL